MFVIVGHKGAFHRSFRAETARAALQLALGFLADNFRITAISDGSIAIWTTDRLRVAARMEDEAAAVTEVPITEAHAPPE